MVVAGCGRIGFDPTGGGDGAACVAAGPWSTPLALGADINASGTNWGEQVSGDGLTLYYTSSINGPQTMFVATRATRSDEFANPQLVGITPPTGNYDDDPSVTADGLELWFDRTPVSPATGERIFLATRATSADAWSPPVAQTQLDNNQRTDAPYISPDGLVLYFTEYATNTIWTVTRASRSVPFGTGTAIQALTAGTGCGTTTLTRDQLAIYLACTTGPSSAQELWTATRATAGDAFGPLARVPDIGISGAFDVDPSITDDGRELYFASNRVNSTTFLIYVATRACQ